MTGFQIPIPSLINCVLEQVIQIPVPQFPHLEMRIIVPIHRVVDRMKQ